MSRRKTTEATVILVPSTCSAEQVSDTLADLRARTAQCGRAAPARLDLTAPEATAFALQLLASAAVTLRQAGAFAGFGPVAAGALHIQATVGDSNG